MNIPQCQREQEVLDAVRSGRWSGPWGEELRRHAAVCPACAEVAMVAAALGSAYEDACAEARLPSAGLVWWRAQLAARRAADKRAAQPIALAERAAQAAAAFSAVGLTVWQWPRIAGWWSAAQAYTSGPEPVPDASAWLGRLLDCALLCHLHHGRSRSHLTTKTRHRCVSHRKPRPSGGAQSSESSPATNIAGGA